MISRKIQPCCSSSTIMSSKLVFVEGLVVLLALVSAASAREISSGKKSVINVLLRINDFSQIASSLATRPARRGRLASPEHAAKYPNYYRNYPSFLDLACRTCLGCLNFLTRLNFLRCLSSLGCLGCLNFLNFLGCLSFLICLGCLICLECLSFPTLASLRFQHFPHFPRSHRCLLSPSSLHSHLSHRCPLSLFHNFLGWRVKLREKHGRRQQDNKNSLANNIVGSGTVSF